MKLEEQRIAIHQACGYQLTKTSIDTYWKKPNETLLLSDFMRGTATPDYLNSLDAMHRAVETLRGKEGPEWFDFQRLLMIECGSWMNCIQATATQRAEAFLRTLGLWTT